MRRFSTFFVARVHRNGDHFFLGRHGALSLFRGLFLVFVRHLYNRAIGLFQRARICRDSEFLFRALFLFFLLAGSGSRGKIRVKIILLRVFRHLLQNKV